MENYDFRRVALSAEAGIGAAPTSSTTISHLARSTTTLSKRADEYFNVNVISKYACEINDDHRQRCGEGWLHEDGAVTAIHCHR
jgi:hypothetical protein